MGEMKNRHVLLTVQIFSWKIIIIIILIIIIIMEKKRTIME